MSLLKAIIHWKSKRQGKGHVLYLSTTNPWEADWRPNRSYSFSSRVDHMSAHTFVLFWKCAPKLEYLPVWTCICRPFYFLSFPCLCVLSSTSKHFWPNLCRGCSQDTQIVWQCKKRATIFALKNWNLLGKAPCQVQEPNWSPSKISPNGPKEFENQIREPFLPRQELSVNLKLCTNFGQHSSSKTRPL